MSEAILWNLYRRLLGAHLLQQRLPPSSNATARTAASGAAIAAALTANLLKGDTLGLAPGDLTTRYLCGVPIDQVRATAQTRRGRRKAGGWALAADQQHGLLPGAGAEQASLAVGTALAARLHHSHRITVLLDGTPASPASSQHVSSVWEHAAQTAIALELPLLFVVGSSPALPLAPQTGPKKPPAAMPTIPVDRGDTLALYRVIYESAARARTGGGPTWIECSSWKIAGAPPDKAPPTPLQTIEEALRARQLFDRQQRRQIENALEKEFTLAGWPL